jgi:hypothetical protein
MFIHADIFLQNRQNVYKPFVFVFLLFCFFAFFFFFQLYLDPLTFSYHLIHTTQT